MREGDIGIFSGQLIGVRVRNKGISVGRVCGCFFLCGSYRCIL